MCALGSPGIKMVVMYTAMAPARRSKLSIAFTSTMRVLFTTLLFTAGGMGAGLFLGIVGTIVYGMIRGSQIDMTNAYKHVAIPVALAPAPSRWSDRRCWKCAPAANEHRCKLCAARGCGGARHCPWLFLNKRLVQKREKQIPRRPKPVRDDKSESSRNCFLE